MTSQWHGPDELQQLLRPMDELILLPDNPRRGNVAEIAKSLARFGQRKPIAVNGEGIIIAGNHTYLGAQKLGWAKIACVDQSDLADDEQRAYALADNRLGDLGSYDQEALRAALLDQPDLSGLGFVEDDIVKLDAEIEAAGMANKRPHKPKATMGVDLYMTQGTPRANSNDYWLDVVQVFCCLAVKSGWKYGTRSSDLACGAAGYWDTHRPGFVDNHYHDYDHDRHLDVVKYWRPKYATVRDIMSPEQCKADDIEFYETGQILEWAEELGEYAENVIVIPKTMEGLEAIPDKYVIGYSVPTSYGGTPIPFDALAGRRIHLLGGSPKKQFQYYSMLPDDVVSLDNNYILKTARYASVFAPDGSQVGLEAFNLMEGAVNNPMYVSLVISMGVVASWFDLESDGIKPELVADINDEGVR